MSYISELRDTMESAAEVCIRSGETSADLYARAVEQERTGFGVSADYTRLLASVVKSRGH